LSLPKRLEPGQKFDLNFIELPDDLLAKLAREKEQERGTIPVGLHRGVVRPIPTVVRTGTVVHGRADMPDDFACVVAKAMDDQQHLLQWKHLYFSYNVHNDSYCFCFSQFCRNSRICTFQRIQKTRSSELCSKHHFLRTLRVFQKR
jgi:hypothetical protein